MLSPWTYTTDHAIARMNHLGLNRQPFLFIIDFDFLRPVIIPLDGIDPSIVRYEMEGRSLPAGTLSSPHADFTFRAMPVGENIYLEKFKKVMAHIRFGNTYLINLTQPTKIETDLSLEDIYHISHAPYKLWVKNMFTVFSPERFVKTIGNSIFSHPMKGTADANLPDAENHLLNSPKEVAEHYTIVDLIRNDLAMVSTGVKVNRFMYTTTVHTHRGALLQASSEIEGQMPENWHENIGEMLFRLLPAGSVSGAPKKKTVEIIKETEGYERGYYTGVFGLYDGDTLNSAVMIRFIEQGPDGLIYKSGGGITHLSEGQSEYREMIQKVYVPVV